MRKIEIDKNCAYYLTDYSARRYFSQVDLDEGILILSNNPTYFIDERYYYAVEGKVKKSGITPALYKNLSSIKEYFVKNKIEKLLVDFDHTTLTQSKTYTETFNLPIFDCGEQVKRARAVKDDKEIKSVKKACQITEKAFYESLKTVREGMTESELRDALENKMIELGAEGTSFSTIVAFGKNSAIPHHQTGKTKLKKNSPILVDMGCKVNGYSSDFTRTVFFGQPNAEFVICYNQVKIAHLLGLEKIKSGMTGREADAISRDYLVEQGKGEYFTHSLGHGVGIDIHENPYLNTRSEEVLSDGMVFSVEPGLYYVNEFGVRIEDTVTLKNGTTHTFYSDDKELIILDNK